LKFRETLSEGSKGRVLVLFEVPGIRETVLALSERNGGSKKDNARTVSLTRLKEP